MGRGPTTSMRMRGLEPPRARAHGDLNAARLPIPPHPRGDGHSSASVDEPGRATKRRTAGGGVTQEGVIEFATLLAVLPPSSRGLGRRPLTAETGVRIPVAVLRGTQA